MSLQPRSASNTSSAPGFRFSAPAAFLALVPVAFLFVVYWYGLKNWFEQDDFAWLGLHLQVNDFRSFLSAMFAPMAQGTIRPWSERGFFLLFYRLFQANALPYHLAAFVTHAVNLVLLALVMRKLTGSHIAALAAPVLWTANSAWITPLCWVSDYNQVQEACFLLAAFLCYLHNRYWLQIVVFILGFGALELNIVYPAIVLAHVALCRFSRAGLLRTIPLFAVSGVYYLVHSAVAPRQTAGVYALHFDSSLGSTLGTYWTYAFAPANANQPLFTVVFATACLLGFIAYELWRGRRLPLFFLLWFFIALAPVLPLRDHISDYYLAIPVLGLGAIFALALASREWPVRFAILVPIGLYLFIHLPLARFGSHWYFEHSRAVRNLVWGVAHARELHPGKALLLTGLTDDLYLDSVAHSAFRSLEIPGVYLAPETRDQVDRLDAENTDVASLVVPVGTVIHAIAAEKIVVYDAREEHLRNVTSRYERSLGQRYGWNEEKYLPRRIDAGSSLMAYLLGSTWYPPEGNFRWMPAKAAFRIGGPQSASAKLRLNGFCPVELTQTGPLTVSLSLDGVPLSQFQIVKPETAFSRNFVLPANLVGRDAIEVVVEVNRTLEKPKGSPPLGLAFGVFEIR